MRKSLGKPKLKHAAGFTLLELLVVIAIIGILAGLMFPATTGIMRKAERTRASNTAYNLKTAISSYFTEYRKYPVPSEAQETDDLKTDFRLMNVLLGADEGADNADLNPRRIAFYSGKQAKRGEGGTYKSGISLNDDGGGELWDPWFQHYFVRLDLDYNSRVERPDWDDTSDSNYLPESILVWSAGKDEDEQTKGDNVKTW